MIKRLLAAAVLMLCASSAFATVNVRQNGDGTADYVGSTDTVRFGNCVGGFNVTIPVELNRNITGYGVSPATNAVIRGAYLVTPMASTGTATIKVYANNVTTPVRFLPTLGTSATYAAIKVTTAAAGSVYRISRTAEVSNASGTTSNTLEEGQYIAVGSDGGGTVTGAITVANAIVQVCPR